MLLCTDLNHIILIFYKYFLYAIINSINRICDNFFQKRLYYQFFKEQYNILILTS
jgi:hypothetical protein